MKLKITSYAWEKILVFTDLCPNEISGLGKVEMLAGDFVVTDVAIFEQVVSAAHSTIEPKALAKFQDERVKKGESMKPWCLWWHSHAEMSVFFSGTDTGTIEQSNEFPYLISLVVNKKHDKEARLDLFKPFRMTHEPLQIEILQTANEKLTKLCQNEITKKVKVPKEEKGPVFKGYSGFTGYPDTQGYMGSHETGFKSSKELLSGYRVRSHEDYVHNIPFDEPARKDREQEFKEHRKYLLTQIAKAKRNKEKIGLRNAQRQLSEWDSWGRGLGLTTNGN